MEDELEKDVFKPAEPTISMDGKQVEVNDILLYTISYHNATDEKVTVKITDTVPEHTTYVEGSASHGR